MEAKLLTADRFVDADMGISYRYVHSSTEFFRPHYHDYYEIFIPLSSNALHLVNGKEIPLLERTVIFIRPEDTHDYICQGTDSFDMLNITFTKETAEGIFSYIDMPDALRHIHAFPLPPTALLSESEFSALLDRMNSIRLIGTDKKRLKGALRLFVARIIFENFLVSPEAQSNVHIPLWLTELCERLRENNNFIEGISAVDRLSEKSREHIARSMKKYYGMTLSEYINDLRLNYIANMLLHSNHDILDIIFQSGFNNVSWCYKCFSKKYGVSPDKYRKTNG
ncbi:MAG: helix-turn-helix domain-containing protein [Ruminococcaceae bacterium]|nr:helix-turn-helix domain-containing protein [Oscillospiraceae bacterium]